MTEVNVNGSIDLNLNRGKKTNNNDKRPRIKKDTCKPRVKTDEEYVAQLEGAMQKAGGHYVKFDNIEHTEGLMVAGVQCKDGKYMFAVMNCDRKVQLVENNEHFSVIHNVPASLYVLDYVYHRNPEILVNIVDATFYQDEIKPITKVYIKIAKKVNKDNKKNTKKAKKNTKKNTKK